MNKFEIVICLLLISAVSSNCGPKKEKPVVASTGSTRLLIRGDALFENPDKTEAIEIYMMAIDTAMAEDNNSDLTEAYSQIARCYLASGDAEEGRTWLDKAAEIASRAEPSGWTRYLGVKGRFLWKEKVDENGQELPEVGEAAKLFTEMFEIAVKNDLHNRAIDAANMMSIVGPLDDRIDWSLKGIKAAEEGNLSNWLAPLWNNLGWNYYDMGRYDDALEALKEARRYHYIKAEEKSMLIADWSVAHAYRMAGKVDSALEWSTQVAVWAKDIYDEDRSPGNAEWLGMAYKEIGECALIQGDKNRALAAFTSALNYLKSAGMEEWDETGYKELLDKKRELLTEAGRKR